jgi:hypothetical protein
MLGRNTERVFSMEQRYIGYRQNPHQNQVPPAPHIAVLGSHDNLVLIIFLFRRLLIDLFLDAF